MKDIVMNDLVLQKLNEFESLESIKPSAGWNESMMNKLDSAIANPGAAYQSSRFTIVVLLVIIINLGFILNSIIHTSNQSIYKDKDLKVISEELLINPISAKN